MKLEDIPTPIADGIWNKYSEEGDDFSYDMYLSHQAVEKKLALVLAENARLKAALDRYSEDEILLIERCAKVCESVYESYESKCDTWPEARPDALSGAEDCIRAIRELKVAT
jgi:hypothetical protein